MTVKIELYHNWLPSSIIPRSCRGSKPSHHGAKCGMMKWFRTQLIDNKPLIYIQMIQRTKTAVAVNGQFCRSAWPMLLWTKPTSTLAHVLAAHVSLASLAMDRTTQASYKSWRTNARNKNNGSNVLNHGSCHVSRDTPSHSHISICSRNKFITGTIVSRILSTRL